MGKFYVDAKDDAKETAKHFLNEIVDSLVETGEASNDLYNDYPDGDSYHHESHLDRDYNLLEAAQLLDDLSDWEEDDSGLWQGLEPRRAVAAQAAYTYGNCVCALWYDLIKKINDDDELQVIIQDTKQDSEDDEPDSSLIRARVLQIIDGF